MFPDPVIRPIPGRIVQPLNSSCRSGRQAATEAGRGVGPSGHAWPATCSVAHYRTSAHETEPTRIHRSLDCRDHSAAGRGLSLRRQRDGRHRATGGFGGGKLGLRRPLHLAHRAAMDRAPAVEGRLPQAGLSRRRHFKHGPRGCDGCRRPGCRYPLQRFRPPCFRLPGRRGHRPDDGSVVARTERSASSRSRARHERRATGAC